MSTDFLPKSLSHPEQAVSNSFETDKCTLFRNFSTPIKNSSLGAIAEMIASDKYKTEIELLRKLIDDGKTQEAQTKKQNLVAFTPSGIFSEKRLLPNLVSYSNFVHLDFDKLDIIQLQAGFIRISECPFTCLCFRSPSGNGLKVFIEVNTGVGLHAEAYSQVLKYYENLTGLKADDKCKDITRLCFMSYDPDLYKPFHYSLFEVNLSNIPIDKLIETKTILNKTSTPDYSVLFKDCVNFSEKIKTYQDGQRNDFIYTLASNCNRKGIPELDALGFAQSAYDLPAKEITASFHSAYTHHNAEFANFASFAKIATCDNLQIDEDLLKTSPFLPNNLHLQMPQIILQGAEAFTDSRERDVFITASLTILSGCLPGVKGIYAGQEVFTNLFSFIVAPAASGKGSLKYAKMLADEYHNSVLTESRSADAHFTQEMVEYKNRINNKKKGDITNEEEPVKPTFRVVYIPANTSHSKLLWHLEQNDGKGIICETEADTLGNTFKQDWGSYSDMLRKAFHHEKISSSRKLNNEFTEVNSPSLSIALSGTPGQVTGLISSAEDGLFSRFLFYVYRTEQKWKDVSPKANKINLTTHFKALSVKVLEMVQFLQNEYTVVLLTTDQWNDLNTYCEKWLSDIVLFNSDESGSIVKRLGLILYRICMLFSAMRKFENGEAASEVYCTDNDFEVARLLIECYLSHSILMYNNLPKPTKQNSFNKRDNKSRFIEALPNEFTTKMATEIGSKYELSYSTVTHLLPKMVPAFFFQPKQGYYQKIVQTS